MGLLDWFFEMADNRPKTGWALIDESDRSGQSGESDSPGYCSDHEWVIVTSTESHEWEKCSKCGASRVSEVRRGEPEGPPDDEAHGGGGGKIW
jgi:hypothetical protein